MLIVTFKPFMQSVIMLNECRYAGCYHAKYRGASVTKEFFNNLRTNAINNFAYFTPM
jgi:hypothetical protein